MSMQVNKKMLQQELSKTTGKAVTLRDLTNLAAKNKKNLHNDLICAGEKGGVLE